MKRKIKSAPSPSVSNTADKIIEALQTRLKTAADNFNPANRPIATAAKGLLNGTLDIRAEVNRLTNVEIDTAAGAHRNPILIVTSKFGTWASELTIVAGVLLKAGYKVKVATEDGSPPHLLSPSLDPQFQDGAWRCSVVSDAEGELALRFLNPNSAEHDLLKRGAILNLSELPKPPQVGDYIKNPSLLDHYKAALPNGLGIANRYDAIVITGGSGAIPGLIADRGLHSLILAFHELGKAIMGECNGGLAIAQTLNPETGKSILAGRAVTTHSWLDEYQSGWGWVSEFSKDPDVFWKNGQFDLAGYSAAETWCSPGIGGNPLIDSEAMFKNAVGLGGTFFSPPGTPYSVVVDGNLITCRTTPDGYPGVLGLLAILDGKPPLTGRFFIDDDEMGRPHP
jgi:putative intracellular protease/amidase